MAVEYLIPISQLFFGLLFPVEQTIAMYDILLLGTMFWLFGRGNHIKSTKEAW